MATQKPISTISYNTVPFLKEKLDSWVSAHIIQCYQYIWHKGEDGDKDHVHLRIEPNRKLDPMDLTAQLTEHVSDNPKPLGVRPWRPSKEEDWFLYVVHDKKYMALKYPNDKGEKLPYKWQDIVASDLYDVQIAFIRAKASLEHTASNVATRIRDGASPHRLVMEGENPFVVNTIMRVMHGSDYTQLASDLENTKRRYDLLLKAVHDAGFIVGDKDGRPCLERFD